MPASRLVFKRLGWIVCLTFLLGAVLPTLSQAMIPAPGGMLAEICSASGMRMVWMPAVGTPAEAVDDAAIVDEASPNGAAPDTAASSMNCPYCAIHHGAPALPPSAPAWQPPDALRFAQPTLFLQSPRPLFAWAPALARAPPRIA